MERFTARLIAYIVIALVVVATATVIWEAIPGIVKVIAIVGIVVAFINMMKK